LGLWAWEYRANCRLVLGWSRTTRLALLALASLAVLASWAYVLAYRREDDFATSWVGRFFPLFWP
jgi:hypothetical protein